MEYKIVHLLDLPDELLLIIMNKLSSFDVLYSLLEVNKRLDSMARRITHIKCLDFSTISSVDKFYFADFLVLKRFCCHILPQIHQNLEEIICDHWNMKRILLAAQY